MWKNIVYYKEFEEEQRGFIKQIIGKEVSTNREVRITFNDLNCILTKPKSQN